MEKNINYEEGKQLLNDYIKRTEKHIEWLKDISEKYNNTLFDLPDFSGFDFEKIQIYIHTWEIILDLPVDKKNLFLIFCACDYNYKRTLQVFNGIGKGCKNIATLRVLISVVRKIIRGKYNERYGTN